MTKILYLDCSSGISGDMFLGSLIDCGVKIDYLISQLRKIKINGYILKARKVKRNGIVGTKFDVLYKANDTHKKERAFKGIVKLINDSALASDIKKQAISVFKNLADAERAVHAVHEKDIHFHEVGDIDSIVDIVGSCIAIKKLDIDEVYSSPLKLGLGKINVGGSSYPNPAPATIDLLKRAQVEFSDVPYELVTPTGAAILKTLSNGFGQIPAMKILKVGYGAGTYEIPNQPNLLRAIIGEKVKGFETDVVTVIETNIDDMNPQGYEYLMERIFKAGALDVYLTPVIMKKSRPGCVVTILTEFSKADDIAKIIFEETTSLGLRQYQTTRRKLNRKIVEIKTKYDKVKVKLGFLGDELKVVAPEYEDCKRIARTKGLAFRQVYEEVKLAASLKFSRGRS